MQNISLIKQKILQYLDFIGVTKYNFYQKTGITRGVLDKEGGISEDNIAKFIAYYPEINPEWLLTGVGNMIKSEKAIVKHVSTDFNESIGIPLIPIDAMAGFEAGEMQIIDYEGERFVVPTFKGAEFLIQFKGSSMYPKYSSGDIVACKKLCISDIFFQPNKVYVLDTEQGALIKRIDNAEDDNYIILISDNEKYKPFPLHKSKINAISIVMGAIKLD